LDIPSIDALIGALEQYDGTIIFISHDVHFIRAIAKQVLHISAGKLTPYAGDYEYYLDKTKAVSAREGLVAGDALSNAQPKAEEEAVERRGPGLREMKEQKRAEAEQRKAAAKAKRDLEQKVTALELKIADLEARQRHLTARLQDPITHLPGGPAGDLARELTELTGTIHVTTAEWERATEELMAE
jgi:ATP-binding cassette subfamily F protein 3